MNKIGNTLLGLSVGIALLVLVGGMVGVIPITQTGDNCTETPQAQPLWVGGGGSASSNGVDFFLGVARGNVQGMSSINKYGRNIEIDSTVVADVWDGGKATSGESLIWVAPTQARTHVILCANTNDSSTGTGAKTIEIFGLTTWDTTEEGEVISLIQGSVGVTTAKSYVIIHRMKVLTKGAADVNIGNISATATTDGTVTALILAGQGQTHMAIYGIPSIQKLYLGRLYADMNKAGGQTSLLDTVLLVNPEPDVEITNFLSKQTFGLMSAGTSALPIIYYTPKVIDGPAIVKMQVTSGTDNIDVSAGFNGILVNN